MYLFLKRGYHRLQIYFVMSHPSAPCPSSSSAAAPSASFDGLKEKELASRELIVGEEGAEQNEGGRDWYHLDHVLDDHVFKQIN